jgi:hypothetical protein
VFDKLKVPGQAKHQAVVVTIRNVTILVGSRFLNAIPYAFHRKLQVADAIQDNINPAGRLYYAASTMVCVTTSLAQEVGTALGAQAGVKRLREAIVEAGGFSQFRRAAETPFNMVLEARP